MIRYIVGLESNLGVTESAPRVVKLGKGGPIALWPHSSVVGRWQFGIKRGFVEEHRSYDDDERVYARVFPEDAAPELAEIEAKLAANVEENKRLRAERQALLAAVVPRAERVKVKP